jgi:hypothetical protein
MSGLWRRYRGWPKWVQIVLPIVVLLIVIGASSGGSKKKPLTPAQQRQAAAVVAQEAVAQKAQQATKAKEAAQAAAAKAKAAKQAAAQKVAAEAAKNRITLKISGSFDRSCGTCYGDPAGDLESRLATSDVYCGWQNGKVVVHVTVRNTSVEHVTMTWLPTYTVKNGGVHGNNVLFPENSGIDANATRQLLVTQHPDGVPANSPLSACSPSFFNIKNG